MNSRLLLVLSAVFILASCISDGGRKGGYYEDDGPPTRSARDFASIPDATPEPLPRSRTGNRPYTVFGKRYVPLSEARGFRQQGEASWYGKKFHGNLTSSGERYDMFKMTAAHKVLPLPSFVRVRNLDNDRTIVVKVNDRGPFLHNRIIDLSYAAAMKLGIVATGTGRVVIETVFSDGDKADLKEPLSDELIPLEMPQQTTGFYVQAGAFGQIANAYRLRAKLEGLGFSQVNIKKGVSKNRELFIVRIGPFPTLEETTKTQDRLDPNLTESSRIVSQGGG